MNLSNKKDIIILMKKLLAGEVDTITFWHIYKENNEIKNLINKDKLFEKIYYSPQLLEKNIDLKNPFDKYKIIEMVRIYLFRNSKDFKINNQDYKNVESLIENLPKYINLDFNNLKFWLKLLNSLPTSDKERSKFIKYFVKENFKYKEKPPKWIQGPEWPIENDKPLIFIKQSVDQIDNSLVTYTFYNENNKTYKLVEQYY